MASINIKSDREYLREIFAKVKSGKYVIPVFQRDYVWSEQQILDFFDSISKGYPIGSVILWKSIQSIPSKDILTDEKNSESTPDYYVLDGRQRLTTFYGCVLNNSDKPERFRICYNLETETFEPYKKGKTESMLLSDIYDTFTLLGRLQELLNTIEDKEKALVYVERAKRLNSILQEYTVAEVLLDNCNLDEASTVFSRINSMGTDISKSAMLQATFFKKGEGILFSEEIDKILDSLNRYNFDALKSDDVLNCFYKYVGKNFYDAKITDLENLNFTSVLSNVKEDLIKSVEFLNQSCYVLSSKLLPYTKQLIALTWFFKEVKKPDQAKLNELKRWFFYTTYQQSFQNGSMSNVRSLFCRFEDFIFGRKETAIDYEPIKIEKSFDFKFRINSAKTDFLILSQIYHYAKYEPLNRLLYLGNVRVNINSPGAYFVWLKQEDKEILYQLLNTNKTDDDSMIAKYCLNSDLLLCLRSNLNEFVKKRTDMLVQIEIELLQSVKLDVLT